MKYNTLFALCITLSFIVGAHAQKPNVDYLKDLEAAGYPAFKVFSFDVTKKKFALTALYKSEADKDPLRNVAEILPTKEGTNMAFRTYRPCVITEKQGKPQERIIMVAGQKIEAYYACGITPNESKTHELFLIKSLEGNEFTKKQFSELEYVFVHLNDLPVPFDTGGFSRALTESSGKAL
jgi:hypothetical protein